LVIRQYDHHCNIPTTSSGFREWQLKPVLPAFCSVSRSVHAVKLSQLNCCSLAKCLYVNSVKVTVHTGRERMAKLRQSTSYRVQEREHDRISHQTARENKQFKSTEQSRDTIARKTARQDEQVRSRERSRDAKARQTARKDEQVRSRERSDNTSARKAARLDEQIRSRERSRDAKAHQTARKDEQVKSRERSANTLARKTARQDEEVRLRENVLTGIRKNICRQCNTIDNLIVQFHCIVSNAPTYVCTSCD